MTVQDFIKHMAIGFANAIRYYIATIRCLMGEISGLNRQECPHRRADVGIADQNGARIGGKAFFQMILLDIGPVFRINKNKAVNRIIKRAIRTKRFHPARQNVKWPVNRCHGSPMGQIPVGFHHRGHELLAADQVCRVEIEPAPAMPCKDRLG